LLKVGAVLLNCVAAGTEYEGLDTPCENSAPVFSWPSETETTAELLVPPDGTAGAGGRKAVLECGTLRSHLFQTISAMSLLISRLQHCYCLTFQNLRIVFLDQVLSIEYEVLRVRKQ
jgi:hypothetical protein